MTLFVDRPIWKGHGRQWSHLVSDTSFEELHAAARELGIPPRGFDADHYDIPSEWFDKVVALGAQVVSPREIVRVLYAAGLRRRKGSRSQSSE